MTPFEPQQFVAEIGVPFHVALCWDVNGIDGTSNTVRLYRNGELVSAIDDSWDATNTTTKYEGFNLGLSPDGGGYDKFISDELKVWNFAKTNFADTTGNNMDEDLIINSSASIAGNLEMGGNIIFENDSAGLSFADGSSQSKANRTYEVGDFAHGGVVFWVDESGEHGLVCAKADQSEGVRWYAGTYGNTQAKGDGMYAGEANTSIIIAAHVAIGDDESPYAARICNELQVTENGRTYGDWYLPSHKELILMNSLSAIIDATATANGGTAFANGEYYWSSTEYNSNYVFYVRFGFGYTADNKVNVYRVRAIRAF